MKNILVQRSNVNIEGLDAEIRVAVGNLTSGVSAGSYGVMVHLADSATELQISQVQALVQTHDPSLLTSEQQTRLVNQQKLATARQEYKGAEIDLSTYQGKDALTLELARKIAWLEQEIANLGGGGA